MSSEPPAKKNETGNCNISKSLAWIWEKISRSRYNNNTYQFYEYLYVLCYAVDVVRMKCQCNVEVAFQGISAYLSDLEADQLIFYT